MTNAMSLPKLEIGMTVVTPSDSSIHLTPEKPYTILDVEDGWIMVQDDVEDIRYYRSHLFIEIDIYHRICMYLTMMRLFGITLN